MEEDHLGFDQHIVERSHEEGTKEPRSDFAKYVKKSYVDYLDKHKSQLSQVPENILDDLDLQERGDTPKFRQTSPKFIKLAEWNKAASKLFLLTNTGH